jgi:hypothetical protein
MSANQRPYSARQRPPSGRSNMHGSPAPFQRPQSATAVPASTKSIVIQIPDPTRCINPASPRIHPSIFEPSRYPTIPPVDPPPTKKHSHLVEHLHPTQHKHDHSPSEHWLNHSEAISHVDSDVKREVAIKFLSRNRDRLWKIHSEFRDTSPKKVFNEINDIDHEKFVPLMKHFHSKERVLNLSGSDRLKHQIIDEHLEPPKKHPKDPFSTSLQTSREERIMWMEADLSAEASRVTRIHRRGYQHLPEVGNFSSYVGHLNRNRGAILNR